MPRTLRSAAALLLLATFSLSSCALTAKAWRRGLSGVRHRGGGNLEVAELWVCPKKDVLWCKYTRTGTSVSWFREHLPVPGWLAVQTKTAVRIGLERRSRETQPCNLRIQVRKDQRGSRIRWRAALDFTERTGVVRSEGPAWTTAERPGDDLQRLHLRRGRPSLSFDFYKRRSRAHLVTEAAALTPPLLIADCVCNVGWVLAQVDWGEVLADAIVGGVTSGISCGISKGGRSSRKKRSGRAKRASRKAKKPSGPPRLGQRRRRR